MMGRTHATSGAVAFLAAAPLLGGIMPTSAVAILLGGLTAAGAAMVPDMDHPSSSAARSIGPLTGLTARLVARITGGHRQGTHSLLGILAAAAVTAVLVGIGGAALGVWVAFLLALGTAAIGAKAAQVTIVHTMTWIVLGTVATTTFVIADLSMALLVPAVAIGAAAHVAGDMLTKEGCPLLWPHPHRFKVANLRTGGLVETLLVGPGLGVVALALGWIQLRDRLPAELATLAGQADQWMKGWM